MLRIDWVEQSGPVVSEPEQRGFGSKLIEGSIAAELGGEARLGFEPHRLALRDCCSDGNGSDQYQGKRRR